MRFCGGEVEEEDRLRLRPRGVILVVALLVAVVVVVVVVVCEVCEGGGSGS